MTHSHLKYLFEQYLAKKATDAECIELFNWMETSESTPLLIEHIDAVIMGMPAEHEMDPEVAHAIMHSILGSVPVVKRMRPWKWMAAVAAMLAMIIVGFSLWHSRQYRESIAPALVKQQPIGPGTNKAILTLENGEQLLLDSAGRQQIVRGGVAAMQSGGSLAYKSASELQYHTLSTPKGGEFNLHLPDGTVVWLNAGSAITYPTNFDGKERRVKVRGEVYIKVAKDAAKPFLVNMGGGQEIEVLGTEFNINAYDDEPVKRTTLVSGSIRYHVGLNSYLLKPGQQASLSNQTVFVAETDIANAVAWRNGLFYFAGASLQDVMRQLSRWYNVEVEYQGRPRLRMFEGKIEKGLTLQDVLDVLAKNKVKYKIEARKIIILP